MWPPPHGCGEPVFHAVSDEGEALLVLILTSNTPPALGLPETENQDEYLSSLCLSSPSHGLLGPEMGRFPASTIQASWPSCHRQNQTLHAWKQFYDLSPTYKPGCLASYAKWELNKFRKSYFSPTKA